MDYLGKMYAIFIRPLYTINMFISVGGIFNSNSFIEKIFCFGVAILSVYFVGGFISLIENDLFIGYEKEVYDG